MNNGACHPRHDQGAVLLEVVLALMLFVGAAAVIGTAMQASTRALDQTRLQLHALDLAVSTFAELQMGSLALAEMQAQPFEVPFEQWTREIHLHPSQTGFQIPSQLKRVEVVVRHAGEHVVHRLNQWMPIPPKSGASASAPGDLAAAPRP